MEGWDRVKGLFSRAVELPAGERPAFLDREVGDDGELRRRIQALLDADAAASRFLEGGPTAGSVGSGAEHADPWAGRRIGRYEVIREVGRGGTGLVLLARRREGVPRRDVALKIVPAALVEPHLEERFRQEVRTLARMDHPNVARLLDAGVTDEGLAYLVMDYVEGAPVDVWADGKALDLRARLDLFLGVLRGIDHAHGRGIVHRDLKPGNVLVGDDGVPRIIDFGIARLLTDAGAGDETVVLTRTAHRMLTPEYASPEQVRGAAIDARSDVYSLGVLLYRLLTGRPPYAVDETRPEAVVRAVCEVHPSRPSEVATRPASRGATSDPGFGRTLRGDLDTIVLHALAKDPAERYATAGAFADDVERFLDGRPIRARPPRALRRTGVWVRRRWPVVAVGAAAVAVVAIGGWQTREGALQRRAAAAAEGEMTALVTSVLETLGDEMAGGDPGPTARRLAAIEAAVSALDSLEASLERPAGPGLLEALAAAHQEVGSVRGHPTSPNVGRPAEAEVSFRRSLELWERLAGRDPSNRRARLEIGETRVLLADLAGAAGELDRQAALLDSAERGFDSIPPGDEDELGRLSILAMLHERQGYRWLNRGDFVRGGEYFESLPDLARRAAAEVPEGPARLASLEEIPLALQLVSLVRSRAGDSGAAIEMGREAVRLADSIADLPGATQRIRGIRLNAWGQLGWRYNEVDRPEEAQEAFDVAVDIGRSIVAGDPANVAARGALGTMLFGRGRARIMARDWAGALEDHEEALPLLRSGYGEGPAADLALAPSWRQIGEALSGLGRFDEAEEAYRTTLALYDGAAAAAEVAQQRKQRAFAEMSYALHLLRRIGVESRGACDQARIVEERARARWSDLRSEALLSEGEEVIWEGFVADRPEEVCRGG